MSRQLLPAEATQQARAALARAGFTGLAADQRAITSNRHGTDYVETTVRVGDADRVLAVLRTLPWAAGSGVRQSGTGYVVWISRRVGMSGG